MIYGLNGQELDAAYSLAGASLDEAYSLAGEKVFDAQQGGGGEQPTRWSQVKWVPIGDSLTWLADTAADNKYPKLIKSAIPDINVINENNGTTFATGYSGYYSNSGVNTNFYTKVLSVPSDATIVTIFGSVNDWKYRYMDGNSDLHFNPLSKYNSLQGNSMHGSVSWVEDPHLDTVDDHTLAGYVNGTLYRLHQQAPNAKVVVIPGLYYIGAGSDYFKNAYFLYQAIVQAWLENDIEGAYSDGWLSFETWYLDANPTKTVVEVDGETRSRYTRIDSFVEDQDQLDYWFEDNPNGTFDSRKIYSSNSSYASTNGVTPFGFEYTRDSQSYSQGDSNAFGHWSNAYHSRYLARKFAHVLINALGWDATTLPTALRYVDANGEPTDTNFDETYFNNESS